MLQNNLHFEDTLTLPNSSLERDSLRVNMSNDEEMQDAHAGAEINGAEEIVPEKQRLRLVRLFTHSQHITRTDAVQAPWLIRHGSLICFREGRPHIGKCAPIYDHEEVTLATRRSTLLFGSNDPRSPDVEFCGYSIPHPSEAVMNLRIQTWDGVNVMDVLRKGLDDLSDLCDVVEEKFTAARDEFNAEHPDRVAKS